jgi:hypothetical protein
MMCAVAAATGRQTRILACLERSLKGAEGEEQNEQECEGTPHLT